MRVYLTICYLFLFLIPSLFAQDKKGVAAFDSNESESGGTTRAVIIGISDYQAPNIPDLHFADKDAEAFAKYLQSPAGGSLPRENIKLLTNENATMAAMAAQLDWLVEVSGEGDKAIIYFSGHGDVEAKTATQPGFLLTYDSPPKIYIAGAYPLFYLQLIVQTLSTDKNVQTLIITDACRAGKLAGSEIGGTQATAANLAKQYANEIKILSCQPDEFSLEGEQWGGGRGAFSYHLIEGLIGLADKNNNGDVNLLELENYLETVVPEETAPQSQIPMTVGSKGTKVAFVNTDVLAKLKDLKARQLPSLAAIESRGFEEALLANADSSIQKKYETFIAALEDDNLLDAQEGKPSADDLYRELIEEESLASLHRFMTRQFATALQDDAQQAVNAYLLANPTELQKRWNGDTTYSQYPRYLGRAAELLGESHYMHDYLIAKQFYFEGLNLRLQLDRGETSHSYEEAIEKQEAAVALESRAACFYNELGVLHTRLKLSEKAVNYYEKAIELAPEWGLPYVNLCLEHHYNNDPGKALENGEKALELMPEYVQLYNLLGWVSINLWGEYSDKRNWERQGVELSENYVYHYDNTSSPSQREKRFNKTITLLEKALEVDSTYAAAHKNLGHIYSQINQLEKAVYHLKRSTLLDPENDRAYSDLGFTLEKLARYGEGEEAFKMAIELSRESGNDLIAGHYNSLGNLYSTWGKPDKALEAYYKAIELNPLYGFPHGNAANIYGSRNNLQKAEWHLLEQIEVYSLIPVAYANSGSFYQSIHRYKDAEWMYLRAIEKLPDYVNAINNLIELYRETGNMEAAMKWQERLLESAPDEPGTHINCGQTAYLFKEFEKAKIHFQKAADLDTLGHWNFNGIGWFYKNHGEYDLAKKYLEQCISIKKDVFHPYVNLALLYLSFGQYKKSMEILNEGLVNIPNAELLQETKTIFSYFAFSPDKSKLIFEETAKKKPTFLKVWDFLEQVRLKEYAKAILTWKEFEEEIETWYFLHLYLGALVQNGDMEAAIKLMNKSEIYSLNYQLITTYPLLEPLRKESAYQSFVRRKFPEKYDDTYTFTFTEKEKLYYPGNCAKLARYYDGEGEFERARHLYEKEISLRPDSLTGKISLQLTEAYLGLGRFEEAKAICPDSIPASNWKEYWDAAKTMHRARKPDQAEAMAQKAVGMDSLRIHTILNFIGLFYTNRGDYERAERYCFRSIENKQAYHLPIAQIIRKEQDYSSSPYIYLARLYQSFNQPEKMMDILKKGLAGNPEDKTLRELEVILGYFAYPPEVAKLKFEEAAKSEPAFQLIWEYLEQIRQQEFSKAVLTWEEFGGTWGWNKGKIDTTNIAYTYLAALVQSGDMKRAIDLLGQMPPVALPYQLLTTYPMLEPLRKEQAYKDYLLRHFPERVLN